MMFIYVLTKEDIYSSTIHQEFYRKKEDALKKMEVYINGYIKDPLYKNDTEIVEYEHEWSENYIKIKTGWDKYDEELELFSVTVNKNILY